MNEILPEPSPVIAPPKIAWHFWVKFCLCIVGLLCIISAGSYFWVISQPSATTNTTESIVDGENIQTPTVIPTQFYSNKANLAFTVPAGWHEVDPASVTAVVGFSNPQFVFIQEELGCIIAAGKFDQTAANYVQTSFGGRVKSPISQFDGSWFTNQAYHKEPITFSKDVRQYRTYELRETYNLDNVDIILWQKNNTAVPDVCNRDYELLLQTTQHHFSPITLKDYFTGTLFIRTEDPGTEKSETRLLYTDNEDKNTYEIVKLPPGTGHSGDVFIREGILYALTDFENEENQSYNSVITIDPITALVEQLPLVNVNEKVFAHYVTPSTVYYMVASSSARCTGYRESCQADLYAYDFASSERKLLTTNITSARLDGFDPVTGTLYLYRGWGDAGCVSNKIDSYHVNTGTLTNVISFSGCAEDAGYNAYETNVNELRSHFAEERSSVINYNVGSLLPLENDAFSSYSSFVFVK